MSVSESVVQLCLKLTESELKSLLSKMAEWRDFDKNSNSVNIQSTEVSTKSKEIIVWQKFSKGVCFYNLISSLASKLRSIFLPSMVSNIPFYSNFFCYNSSLLFFFFKVSDVCNFQFNFQFNIYVIF